MGRGELEEPVKMGELEEHGKVGELDSVGLWALNEHGGMEDLGFGELEEEMAHGYSEGFGLEDLEELEELEEHREQGVTGGLLEELGEQGEQERNF